MTRLEKVARAYAAGTATRSDLLVEIILDARECADTEGEWYAPSDDDVRAFARSCEETACEMSMLPDAANLYFRWAQEYAARMCWQYRRTLPACICGPDHDCRSTGCDDECPKCSGPAI